MGVAVAAVLFGILSFFRLMAALGRLNAWKKRGILCKARVKEVANRTEDFKGRKGVTWCQYAVVLDYDGMRVESLIEETVRPGAEPRYSEGDRIELWYAPNSGRCRDPRELKAPVKYYAIAVAASIAVFIGTLLLLRLLGG